MIEKHYAAHLANNLDVAAINRRKVRKPDANVGDK
jgi:hypothetical protein